MMTMNMVPSFIFVHGMSSHSNTCNTTGVTSGAGTAYPSRLHEFTPRGINNFVFIHTFPTFLGRDIVYFRSQEKFEDAKELPSRRNSKERHFNKIVTISWRSVLLVEETGVPGENHRPAPSH
jgi:hypothetical protein